MERKSTSDVLRELSCLICCIPKNFKNICFSGEIHDLLTPCLCNSRIMCRCTLSMPLSVTFDYGLDQGFCFCSYSRIFWIVSVLNSSVQSIAFITDIEVFCFVDTTYVYLVDVDIVENYIIIIIIKSITEMEITL